MRARGAGLPDVRDERLGRGRARSVDEEQRRLRRRDLHGHGRFRRRCRTAAGSVLVRARGRRPRSACASPAGAGSWRRCSYRASRGRRVVGVLRRLARCQDVVGTGAVDSQLDVAVLRGASISPLTLTTSSPLPPGGLSSALLRSALFGGSTSATVPTSARWGSRSCPSRPSPAGPAPSRCSRCSSPTGGRRRLSERSGASGKHVEVRVPGVRTRRHVRGYLAVARFEISGLSVFAGCEVS